MPLPLYYIAPTLLYLPSERSETGGYYVFTFVCLCTQRKRGSWPWASFSPSKCKQTCKVEARFVKKLN